MLMEVLEMFQGKIFQRAAVALAMTASLTPAAARASTDSVVVLPAALAQAEGTTCSKTWHYIMHGETGRRVRVLSGTADTTVYVDAVAGTDNWNQQFLFCRDPRWSPGHYAIYSNGSGAYWHGTDDDEVYASSPAIEDIDHLFYIFRPANAPSWTAMRWVGSPLVAKFAAPARSRPGKDLCLVDTLVGNALFRITPSDLMA